MLRGDADANDAAVSRTAVDEGDPDYGTPAYWDTRYERLPAAFEWYDVDLFDLLRSSRALASLFECLSDRDRGLHALELGCGTSALGVQLASLPAFAKIVCVDVSPVVVDLMRIRHGASALLSFVCADATDVAFAPGGERYDLVIDKGCLDALCCRRGPPVRRYIEHVWRLLDPDGAFVLVSHGGLRTPLFDFAFQGDCHVLDNGSDDSSAIVSEKDTYLYLLRRRTQLLPDDVVQPRDIAGVDADVDDDDELECAFTDGQRVNVNPAFEPH